MFKFLTTQVVFDIKQRFRYKPTCLPIMIYLKSDGDSGCKFLIEGIKVIMQRWTN